MYEFNSNAAGNCGRSERTVGFGAQNCERGPNALAAGGIGLVAVAIGPTKVVGNGQLQVFIKRTDGGAQRWFDQGFRSIEHRWCHACTLWPANPLHPDQSLFRVPEYTTAKIRHTDPPVHIRPADNKKEGRHMGVFDFVKNAGAKVGIGQSTSEEAAEEAAAAAEAAERAEAATKMAAARRAARAATAATEATAKAHKDEALKEAVAKNATAAKMKAAAKERMAEYKKSAELEDYVKDLGIDMAGVDIRFDDGTAYITGETADQATKERIILSVGNARGVGKSTKRSPSLSRQKKHTSIRLLLATPCGRLLKRSTETAVVIPRSSRRTNQCSRIQT